MKYDVVCDHCGAPKQVNYQLDCNVIYWCKDCILEDKQTLENMRLLIGWSVRDINDYCGVYNDCMFWSSTFSIAALRTIPKKKRYKISIKKCDRGINWKDY